MKNLKSKLLLALFLFSPLANAGNCPLTEKMDAPLPPRGYEFKSIKKDLKQSNIEIFELAPLKGNLSGYTQFWKVTKSTSGKVVELETTDQVPTKEQIDFINAIKNDELSELAKTVDKNGDTLNFNFKKAEDYPVKIGGKISMDHNGKDCFVKEINEKYYDQNSKSIIPNPVYSSNHCEEIEGMHLKAENALLECENKFASYSNNINSILNSEKIGKFVGGGEGGGGSSPIARSVASANESGSSLNLRNFLVSASNPLFKELYKSKELCDLLTPVKVERANSGPSNKQHSSGTKQ